MQYQIRGENLPVLDVNLEKGESIYTEAGGMGWMSANIDMSTNMKGGLGKAIGRVFGGESLFMTTYTCNSGSGLVTFCSEFPGKIVTFDFTSESQPIICQRDAFMAAQPSVELSVEIVRKLGAGFFGGEGFFLQKISGQGTAWLELAGDVTEYELKEGQVLKVDPGHIAAFESQVTYDISRVKGLKNMLFGGEGIFLATLTGPGKIWLQSMPIANLVKKIVHTLPKK